MERTNVLRSIGLFLAAGAWVFALFALASFHPTDWPSHQVAVHGPVQNLCGYAGALVAYHAYLHLGPGIFPVLFFTGVCIAMWSFKSRVTDLWLRAIGLLLLSTSFAAVIHVIKPGSEAGLPEGNGGLIGIGIGTLMQSHFNYAGTLLILGVTMIVGLLLTADDLVLRVPGAVGVAVGTVRQHAPRMQLANLPLPALPRLPGLPNFVTRDSGPTATRDALSAKADALKAAAARGTIPLKAQPSAVATRGGVGGIWDRLRGRSSSVADEAVAKVMSTDPTDDENEYALHYDEDEAVAARPAVESAYVDHTDPGPSAHAVIPPPEERAVKLDRQQPLIKGTVAQAQLATGAPEAKRALVAGTATVATVAAQVGAGQAGTATTGTAAAPPRAPVLVNLASARAQSPLNTGPARPKSATPAVSLAPETDMEEDEHAHPTEQAAATGPTRAGDAESDASLESDAATGEEDDSDETTETAAGESSDEGTEEAVATTPHPAVAADGSLIAVDGPKTDVVVKGPASLKPRLPAPQKPKELGEYLMPTWEALAEAEHGFAEQQEKYVREKAAVLEQAFREFNIEASVVSIDTGPVITMYEISLAPGIKVASITQLQNDIARALAAVSVRIVAPVPGKSTVGIEVPNPVKEKVRLKELMQLAPASTNQQTIPLYLGKDASGEPLITDLTKMPHCLIAGTTGSGKSVCINTIIMSILYTQRPDMVKLILVDPKVVEMAPFKDIPHLMCPVINDCGRATSVLEWACEKMDERYELLAEAGVRQLKDYNRLTREELYERFNPSTPEEEAKIPKQLPYIIIIIDELADLMMTSGKDVEAHIVRLAQKSRAVGIHLILATQRPSANVVTGLIKSNMPSRISFRVNSRMDSRIVLDQNGAELLLGQGDMLFLPPGASKPVRSQGTFIDDKEIRDSVKLVKNLAEAQYEPELVQIKAQFNEDDMQKDDMFDQAVRVVLETKRGSVSLLQRRLEIGYGRAARLIEMMAAAGIVGEYKGTQSREATITIEEWDAMQGNQRRDADSGMSV